jgi:hypothetical protein
MNRGFYSYVKENTNIKTHYSIEFTRDQKVFDIMDTTKFDFSMLNKKEFDFLEDAINTYNALYYDKSVLHVMLFEQVIMNDEVILEQAKDMTAFNILPQKINQEIERVTRQNEALKEENNLYHAYLDRFHLSISDIKKQLETKTA